MPISTVTSNPTLTPPTVHPISSDPGYIMTLSLGGSDYRVFAYTEDLNGAKTYLPANCNSQAFEKIRGFTWGLLNAHDSRRIAQNETPYDLKMLDSSGLTKGDNTTISHDFLIQPVSNLVADQMASAISLTGHPMQASAVKAQDIWTTMEEIIRNEMGRTAQPVQLSTSTNSPASNQLSTPPISTVPTQPSSQTLDSNSSSDPSDLNQTPALSNSDHETPNQGPAYRAPVTATDLNLRGIDLNHSDWYDRIPDRAKLRIVNDILECRCPVGGIYERVWKLFETKARSLSSSVIGLLSQEKRQLSLRCRALPSTLSPFIRQEASQIIETFYQNSSQIETQEKILALMEKEFARKEQLWQYVREQAEAEGVAIADWDHQWAQYHYLENTRRYIHALARWLDNE